MRTLQHVLAPLILSLFLLVGCVTYMKPHPSSSAITSISKNKTAQKANVVISDKDLALEQSAHFGLVGFAFPVSVKVGETLRVYSKEYLSEIFSEVTSTSQPVDGMSVIFEIKIFDISAVGKAAHLELKMVINDKNQKQLVQKTYSANGRSHFPTYLGPATQQQQIQRTTEDAFRKVFDEISGDIQKLIHM